MAEARNLDNWNDMPVPAPQDDEYSEAAWGKVTPDAKFTPMNIPRAKVGDMDVKLEILYCGICHSDLHRGLNELGGGLYPIVPGHEMVGRVVEVGSKVTKVKVGDSAGIGCLADACLDCGACKHGDEQYCEAWGYQHTYGTKKYPGGHQGGNPAVQTFGGYSGSHVLHEHFIIAIPDNIPLERAAPLLCAGITMYEPLRHWGATSGKPMSIGVIGIGGLGTMGLKLAKAMGHRVVAISTSPAKEAIAMEKGADAFVVSKDPESMKSETGNLDLILNTVAAPHQCSMYLPLLAQGGVLVQLGVIAEP